MVGMAALSSTHTGQWKRSSARCGQIRWTLNIRRGAPIAERIADLAKLFGVSRDAVERWTKDARAEEKRAVQDRAYDLWLDCYSQRDIAEIVGREYPAFEGTDHETVGRWVRGAKSADAENAPPDSRQHFDIWQFATADQDAGSQSYFGTMPPQVMENLLWFFTEPATSLSIRLPVPAPLWTWRRRWGGVSGRRTFAAITIRHICRFTSTTSPPAGLMLH